MNIRASFPRDTNFLITLILIASFFTSLPQVIGLWEGRVVTADQDVGLRIIREIILCVIIIYMLFWFKKLYIPSLPVITLTMCYIVYTMFLTVSMINQGYPYLVPISGIRAFQYLPIAYIAFVLALHNYEDFFEKFVNFLKLYVFVQFAIGMAQIFTAPPVHGMTFLGTRPFGTLPAPNLYGFTLATCCLLFYFSKNKNYFWILLSFIGAATSGSRAAFLGVLLIVGFIFMQKFTKRSLVVLVPFVPLVLAALYFISRSPLISGRVIPGEPRFQVWEEILSNINSPSDFFFGWGLGLGSNTISTVFGFDAFAGQFFSDSVFIFLISSFGIIGLASYVFIIAYTWSKSKTMKTTLFIIFIVFYSSVFQIWETFPSNLLLFFLWGWILGKVKFESLNKEPQIQ